MNSSIIPPAFDYASATKYLFDRINYEKVGQKSYSQKNFRLARMHKLLASIGNPHRKYPIVHIAGTKGKGSVAWLIAESLRHNGQNVGLYTSPHLTRLEERFVIAGVPCDESEIVDGVNQIFPIAESLTANGDGKPTFFELTTAIGFLMFANRNVDIAVIEVGLGGRLDCTNVCVPAVSVITSISFDHQQQLGNTIPAIAQEKAGIIKPAIPVVSGVLDPEAQQVIRRKAADCGSELRQLGEDFSTVIRGSTTAEIQDMQVGSTSFNSPSNMVIDYEVDCDRWPRSKPRPNLTIRMKGAHQASNAATAIAALDVLSQRVHLEISDEAVAEAMATTQVPARMQFIPGSPPIILDSAHNQASIGAMLDTLDSYWPRDLARPKIPRVLIYAASSDKEYQKMIEMLLPSCDQLILTQYHSNPRAVDCQTLRTVVKKVGSQLVEEALESKVDRLLAQTHICSSPSESLRLARTLAGTRGLVCITGSFFLAAEIMAAMRIERLNV